MSEQPSLIDALLELAVYAPVGLALTVVEELPELIAKGRSRIEPQVGTAQFVGRIVVAEGRRRACKMAGFGTSAPAEGAEPPVGERERAAGGGEGAAGGREGTAGDGAGSDVGASDRAEPAGDATAAPASEKTSAARRAPGQKAAGARKSAAGPATTGPGKRSTAVGVRPQRAVPDVGSLAIPGYDSLSASQVVARLAGLSPRELSAVGRYEAANRGRRTILTRVSQLEGA